MEWNKSMNEKIYCRIRRVRAVLLTFFLTAAVVLTDAQSIREKEYEKTEIIYCIGDSITYGSGLEDEERLTKSYPAQLGIRLGPRYLIFNYGVRGATLQDLSRKSYRNMGYLNVIEAQSPDVVIIMLGTNDSKQKYWDAERYEEQYLALIDELHNLPGHPYLYLMAPPEAFPAEEGEILYGINNDVIGGEIRNLVPDIAEQSGKLLVHPEYYFSVRRKNLGSYYLIQLVFPDGSDGHFLRYGCLLPDGRSGLIPRL